NVIPASNSVMAWNLKKLYMLFDIPQYEELYKGMLRTVEPHIKSYGSAYSNWASLLLEEITGTYEVAITGDNFEEQRKEFEKYYIDMKIILGSKTGTLT